MINFVVHSQLKSYVDLRKSGLSASDALLKSENMCHFCQSVPNKILTASTLQKLLTKTFTFDECNSNDNLNR